MIAPRIAGPRAAMRKNHERKVLRFDTFGQSQIGGYLKSVRRFEAARLHLSEMVACYLFSNPVLQLQLLLPAVEKVRLTGLDVAGSCDQEKLLVFRRRPKADFLPGQFGLQQLVVGFKRLVLP